MVSWIDRARDEARDRGSSVGGCGEAGGRLQADERAGKDSQPRINNSTLDKPPRTPGRKPNMPSTHASTHLQMFTTFKEQKKVDLMPFDINPLTAK
ncbi:Hypothetical predicted protein [Scomber scombrus]|uniref:Uncharacterized protein n=1 Tax=Scomber scombrus TaxID=13677 RepID=A0AAV1NC81_SCOSC